MQAAILAAGKSTRTYPLTLTKPKPLLKIANKTILEFNLEALKNEVDEIILVIGYKKEMIKSFISKKYKNINIKFIEQSKQLGTGHAVSILEKHINDKFILMLGDNLYSSKDIKNILKYRYSILIKNAKNPENFGVVIAKNGIMAEIIEKPQKYISNLINCGLFNFDKKIFDLLEDIKKSERGEYELTDAIKLLSTQDKIHCVKSILSHQITYPWDLLTADKKIRNNKNLIGKNSKITGKIKNSTIGNNCIIKGKINDSIIMDKAFIDKNSIIENSIIGENVYFNGIAKSSNNVKSIVNEKEIIVEKLGTVIGDNVKAIDANIKPGCKIWPNKKISGSIIHDIK